MLQEGADSTEGVATVAPSLVVLAAKVSEDVVLPTIAGAAPLAEFAEVVAADAAALADAAIPFPPDPAGSVTLAVADPAAVGILFPADLAGSVTVAVADSADAGILFPVDPARILFPADPAEILFPADPVGILFPADTAGILFPADPAGILFPADPAGTAAADVAFLANADPVTMGVTDLADAGVIPMTISENYGGVAGSEGADMWCGGKISHRNIAPAMIVGLVQNYLLNGNSENPREVFGDQLPAPMYPAIPEKYGDREWDDFRDDGYGYYEDVDSRSGSSEYDDPCDYREWDDWSDTDNDEQYWGPFPEEVVAILFLLVVRRYRL